MDGVKNKYNKLNDNGNLNWDTLCESLVTLANDIIPRKTRQKKKEKKRRG